MDDSYIVGLLKRTRRIHVEIGRDHDAKLSALDREIDAAIAALEGKHAFSPIYPDTSPAEDVDDDLARDASLMVHIDVRLELNPGESGSLNTVSGAVRALLGTLPVKGRKDPGITGVGRIFPETDGFTSTLFVGNVDEQQAEEVAYKALQDALRRSCNPRRKGEGLRAFRIHEVSHMPDPGTTLSW